MDAQLTRALGWILIAVGAAFQIAGWFLTGVLFEPWALVYVAAGAALIAVARVRERPSRGEK